MKLRDPHIKIMLALRAGPMPVDQLTERLGAEPHTAGTDLLKEGLVLHRNSFGSWWELTERGREVLPTRREWVKGDL